MAAKPPVVFAASISRVSGDQEQITVNFNGGDQNELRTRLKQASEVIDAHVKKHNAKVLSVTEESHRVLEAARERIRAERDQELREAGLLKLPEEANGGADPAGTADLRADS